jgi:sec-independent protein translocase protein TatA
MFSGGLSVTHWLVVAVVVVLLFGAKRLPDTARGIGRSMRILKAELSTNEAETDAGTHQAVHQSHASATPVVTTQPAVEADSATNTH